MYGLRNRVKLESWFRKIDTGDVGKWIKSNHLAEASDLGYLKRVVRLPEEKTAQ